MMKKQVKRHKIDENDRPFPAIVEQVLGMHPSSISQGNLEKRIQELKNTLKGRPAEQFSSFLTEAECILYKKILSLLHVSIGFSATQWHRAQGEDRIAPATPPLISREQFYLQNLQHLTWSVGSAKQKPSTVSGRDRYTILRLPLQNPKTLAAFEGAWLSPNLVHVANEQECGSIFFARCECESTKRQIQYCGTYQIGEKIRSQMESTYILYESYPFSEKSIKTVRRQHFEDQVVSIEHLSQFLALTVILELRYIGGHYQQDILEHSDNENQICDLIDITLQDDYYQLHSPGIFPLQPIYEIAKINSFDFRFESFLYSLSKDALDQFYSLCDEFSFGYDFDEKILRRAVEEDHAYFIKNLFKLGMPVNIFLCSEVNNEYEPLIYYAITKKALKTISSIMRNNNSYFHSDFQRVPGEFLCAMIENRILDAVVANGLIAPKYANIRFELRYNFTDKKGYHPLIKSAGAASYAFEHVWSQTKMTPHLAGLVICKLILSFSNEHSSMPKLINTIQRLFALGADPNIHYWLPIKESMIDFQLHEEFGYTPLHMALESDGVDRDFLKELFALLIRYKADPYEPALFQTHNGELGTPYTLWSRADELVNDAGDILAEMGLQRPERPQNVFPGEFTVHLVVRLKEAESCRFLMVRCDEQRHTVNQELRLPSAQFSVMDQKNTHNTVKWICLKYHLNTLYAELMHNRLILREIASVDIEDFERSQRDIFFLIDLEAPHLVATNLHCFYSFSELRNQQPYRVADCYMKLLSYLQNPHSIPSQNEVSDCVDEHDRFKTNSKDIEELLQGYEKTYPTYATDLYQRLKETMKFAGYSRFHNLLILNYQHIARVLSKHALTKLLAYNFFAAFRSQTRQYLTVLGLDEKAYFLMDKGGYHQRILFKRSEYLEYYYYPELERMLNYICCKLQLANKKNRSVKSIEIEPLLNQLRLLNIQIIQSGLENEAKIHLLSMILEIFIHFDVHGDEAFRITQMLTSIRQIEMQESLVSDPLILLQQSIRLTMQLKKNASNGVSISSLARAHFINAQKPNLKRSASDELNEGDDTNNERASYENK